MIRFNLKHNMMGFSLRKILNYIFISLCFIAFTLAMIPLIWILAETIIRGISALSIELLLNTAKPPGTPGGGIANYIQGTIILVAIASLIGFPFGLLIG